MADSLQLDVLDVQDVGEVIDKVRSFVQSEEVPGADAGSVAASITISEDLEDFRGELRRRGRNGFEVCDGSNSQNSAFLQFRVKVVAIVQVFREIVAYPTLTDLTFRYSSTLPGLGEDIDVVQVLALLHTIRSLSTLDLMVSSLPSHVEAVARLFSGNTTLRSCTLRIYPAPEVLRTILRPLMPNKVRVQSEANTGLKELVLLSSAPKGYDNNEVCENLLVKLVESNISLEKLEVGDEVFRIPYDYFRSNFERRLMARAVAGNRTLKEIKFECSIVELKELVLRLVPDADGRQANTTLSTLKVSLRDFTSVAKGGSISLCFDWMTDLVKLVESNNTLKHVQISQDCTLILERDYPKAMVVKSRVRDELKRMLNDELRLNTSLESLSVGWWKVLRVGNGHDQWQMKYDGPCLKRYEEYIVKVNMPSEQRVQWRTLRMN
ncbi:hypothetical protein M758_9G112400 [Ceratodon purpureus]|nr:hypothetical protein M758_9G112400 [Ceratodon purpureus]